MPKTKIITKRKNIVGNFRGSEDIFWINIIRGLKKFLEPVFKYEVEYEL